MTALTDQTGSGSPLAKGLHRYAPWLALAVVALLVLSYYNAYRRNAAAWEAAQNKPKPSVAASATAGTKKPASDTKQKPASASEKVSKVVVVSAVTLRKDPSSSSAPIRDLSAGDSLTLVGQVGSWYKVTDAKGVIGWVTASQKYTKVVNE